MVTLRWRRKGQKEDINPSMTALTMSTVPPLLSYMYLAVTLSKLDDFENACNAFEKAIEMESDHLFHLNYGSAIGGKESRSPLLLHRHLPFNHQLLSSLMPIDVFLSNFARLLNLILNL